MKLGQLSIDRKKVKTQHTSPCVDCPFSRQSVRGWLGPLTAEEWMIVAHSDRKLMCHTGDKQCAGAAIFRANVCKHPRDPEALELPRNTKKVFSWDNEFLAHHAKAKP